MSSNDLREGKRIALSFAYRHAKAVIWQHKMSLGKMWQWEPKWKKFSSSHVSFPSLIQTFLTYDSYQTCDNHWKAAVFNFLALKARKNFDFKSFRNLSNLWQFKFFLVAFVIELGAKMKPKEENWISQFVTQKFQFFYSESFDFILEFEEENLISNFHRLRLYKLESK